MQIKAGVGLDPVAPRLAAVYWCVRAWKWAQARLCMAVLRVSVRVHASVHCVASIWSHSHVQVRDHTATAN